MGSNAKKIQMILDAVNKSHEKFLQVEKDIERLRKAQQASNMESQAAQAIVRRLQERNEALSKSVEKVEARVRSKTNRLRDAKRETDRYSRSTRQATTETDKWGRSLRTVQTVILTLGIARLVRSITEAIIEFQKMNNTLGAVFETTARARQEFEFVRGEARRLGLDISKLGDRYAKIAAAAKVTGIAHEDARDIFKAVAEAAVVLGLSMDDVRGALRAIEQMMNKGTVQAEELRGQLGERLPGALGLAAKGMGVTTQELNKMLEQGQVLTADLLPGLARELRREYGGQLEEALNSTARTIDRLKNQLFELKIAIAEAGFEDFLRTVIMQLTTVSESLTKILVKVKDFREALEDSPFGELADNAGETAIYFTELLAASVALRFVWSKIRDIFLKIGSKGVVGGLLTAIAYATVVAGRQLYSNFQDAKLDTGDSGLFKQRDEFLKLQNELLEQRNKLELEGTQYSGTTFEDYKRIADSLREQVLLEQKLFDLRFDKAGASESQLSNYYYLQRLNERSAYGGDQYSLGKEHDELALIGDNKSLERMKKILAEMEQLRRDHTLRMQQLYVAEEEALEKVRQRMALKQLGFERGSLAIRRTVIENDFEDRILSVEDFGNAMRAVLEQEQANQLEIARKSGEDVVAIQQRFTLERIELERRITDEFEKESRRRHTINQYAFSREESTLSFRRNRVEGNPFATSSEKKDQLIPILTRQNALYERRINYLREQEALLQNDTSIEAERLRLEIYQQQLNLQEKQIENINTLNLATLSFQEEVGMELIDWMDNLGTSSQQVANIISGTLNNAIQSVSASITDVIWGTQTWEQAWNNIYQAVIRGLLQMVVQFAVTQAAMYVIRLIWGKAALANAAVEATAAAAMWAPAATAASIATFGGAAAAGTAAFVAAVGIGTAFNTAAAALAGGFGTGAAEGGLIDGQSARRDNKVAMLNGRPFGLASGEFVVNSASTSQNLALLQYVNSGGHVGELINATIAGALEGTSSRDGFGLGSSGTERISREDRAGKKGRENINFAFFGEMESGEKWLQSRRGRKFIIDLTNQAIG